MISCVYLVVVEDTHAEPEYFVFDGYGDAKQKYKSEIKSASERGYGYMHEESDPRNMWKKSSQSLCGSCTVRIVPLNLSSRGEDGY